MKKKRYYPFGYIMINGKLEIEPKESVLIQKIFSEYLLGKSLKKLAEMAAESGLQYSENTEGWNKNMIARILDDKRYQGNNQYPAIISVETLALVEALRKSRATPQSANRYIHKKLICALCGAQLLRSCKKASRICWDCKCCNKRYGHISDEILLIQVINKINYISQNPQLLEKEPPANKPLSLETVRLTNEIDHMLGLRQLDRKATLKLIFDCANEKYKICDANFVDCASIKIKEILRSYKGDQDFDKDTFEQLVDKVILQPDCTVQLKLINQRII